MKVNELKNKWYGRSIDDWGGEASPEYKEFERNYRNVLKDLGNQLNFDLVKFNKNHYCFSAVMKSNFTNQHYYISISDVRWDNTGAFDDILYRTMENDHDWTGGNNRTSKLEDLANNLKNLDLQIAQTLPLDRILNEEEYDAIEYHLIKTKMSDSFHLEQKNGEDIFIDSDDNNKKYSLEEGLQLMYEGMTDSVKEYPEIIKRGLETAYARFSDIELDFTDTPMKYNKIVKCDLYSFVDDKKQYENCYLLTYDDCPDTLEIDLTSDFCFNTEFVAKNREVVGEINKFGELTNFMKQNNILIYNPKTEESTLFFDDIKIDEENKIFYVGGSRDYVLDFNLNVLGWEEEIDFLNKKESEVEL